MSTPASTRKDLTRREALRRLGMAVTAAYVVPDVVMVSQARASGVETEQPSAPDQPSPPEVPTPPTPPSAPENIDEIERDVTETDTCKGSAQSGNAPTISARDFERAQAAVEAGYAKPLDAIWTDFTKNYHGKVVGIEFTGYKWRPRFRFRAISASGRLETVIVSARTGKIEKIVGC